MKTILLMALLTLLVAPAEGLAQSVVESRSAPPLRTAVMGFPIDFSKPFPAQKTAPPPDDRPNWFSRHPVIVGTLLGVGAGAVLTAADNIHNPKFIPAGAGAGAYGGLIASVIQSVTSGKSIDSKVKGWLLWAPVGLAAGVGVGYLLVATNSQ